MERGLGRALVLVVLAAAVALGASLIVRPAEAATVDLGANDNSATAAPGDTVHIAVASPFLTATITGTASGVSASFTFNGAQSIQCADSASASSCDVDDSNSDTAGRQNVANATSVALKVADDSGEGYILLSVSGLGATVTTKVVTVSKASLVGSLDIQASETTIAAADGTSTLTVVVKNAAGTPVGLNGERVSLVTTLGSIECTTDVETQACTVTTADYDHDNDSTTDAVPGGATVVLNGEGVEGQAVITARIGTRTKSVTVTLYGTAKNLTAEPQQDSIEIGGEVFVVLTVTDDAGHPVSGQVISPVSSEEVVGPPGVDKPVLVVTEKDTPIPSPAVGDTALGRGYSKDKPKVESAAAIPACGDDNLDTDTTTSGLQELFGPNDGTTDVGTGVNVGKNEGTNDNGQCVVHVSAPDLTGTDKDATRGVHTLNFQISSSIKASATIEVAGKPASISTDAPAMVDPASVTEITVSVYDDTDVLVGITDVKVRKVDGGGLVEDAGTDGMEKTSNGQSEFTFIAPSSVGTAEILITAGDVSQRVMLTIGEPEPKDTGPTVIELTDGPVATYVAWNDDWGTVSSSTFENVPGLVVVWKWTGTTWFGYTSSPTAPVATKTNYTVAPGDVLYVVSNGAVTITLD